MAALAARTFVCLMSVALVLKDVCCSTLIRRHPVNGSVLKRCSGIRDGYLRATCRSIARNPVFAESEPELKGNGESTELSFDNDFSDRALLGMEAASPAFRVRVQESVPEAALMSPSDAHRASSIGAAAEDGNNGCSASVLSTSQRRSTSPWITYNDFDPLRFPQKIIMAKCLCHGCINISTGEEDPNLLSEEITTKERVIHMDPGVPLEGCTKKTCKEEIIDIPVGCHCLIP